MAFVTWGPMLETGHAGVDSQHRRLVDLVNKLNDAMRAGEGRSVVGGVLEELVRYTEYHFGFEERLMRQFAFPSSAEHVAEHQRFVAEVRTFLQQYETGSAWVMTELMMFLRDWLSNHILKSDKVMVKQVLAKGAASAA